MQKVEQKNQLYITHMTVNLCRSYLVNNNKVDLNEWYKQHVGVELSDDFWNELVELGPTYCTRADNTNNVFISYTM